MKNRIASIALTVVMILGCMITNIDFNVNTVCADPYNIEIRVETKEISIEEIPEDRMVAVEVYASNVPDEDFYIFNVTFKLDQKLEKWIDLSWGENAISSLSVITGTENNYLFLESNTVIHSNKKIENGRVYDVSVYIPPEVTEGDFYEITPVSECYNGYDYTSFVLESNTKEVYGPSNFSFVGGGIKIRSSQPEQPISNDPVPSADNNNSISQSEVSDNQSQINIDTTEETASTHLTETTYSTVSTISSSTKSTTKVSFVTNDNQTESITNIDINTESLNVSDTIKEKNNHTNINILIPLLVIFLLIVAITLTIIIRKRKKK